jgi:ribosomal protein S12 methylthiotransferase
MYSHEENTHAYKLKDNVSQKIKQRRANEIMKVQKKISFEHNKSFRQKTKDFDRSTSSLGERRGYIGRTEYDSPEVDNEVIVCVLPSGD